LPGTANTTKIAERNDQREEKRREEKRREEKRREEKELFYSKAKRESPFALKSRMENPTISILYTIRGERETPTVNTPTVNTNRNHQP